MLRSCISSMAENINIFFTKKFTNEEPSKPAEPKIKIFLDI